MHFEMLTGTGEIIGQKFSEKYGHPCELYAPSTEDDDPLLLEDHITDYLATHPITDAQITISSRVDDIFKDNNMFGYLVNLVVDEGSTKGLKCKIFCDTKLPTPKVNRFLKSVDPDSVLSDTSYAHIHKYRDETVFVTMILYHEKRKKSK